MRHKYLLIITVTIITLIALQNAYFTQINNLILDKLQGDVTARNEIVILGIDDASLSKIGAWPWSREVFAQIFSKLDTAQPRVVGLDVLLIEPRAGDDILATTLNKINYKVVLGSKIIEKEILYPLFKAPNISTGFVNLYQDFDGKIRRTTFYNLDTTTKECEKSLALKIFETYAFKNTVCENSIRQFSYTDTKFKVFSISDVIDGTISQDELKNKIILIGSTVVDLKNSLDDNFLSVFGKTIPGVEVHANILNSLLQNKFQTSVPKRIFLPTILFLSFLLTLLLQKQQKLTLNLLTFAGFLLIINLLGIVLYELGYTLDFIQQNILLITAFVCNITIKMLSERNEKLFIQKAFSQYMNKSLLQKLIQNPKSLVLGGHKKDMTVLFSDIRGFTNISENLSPEALSQLLNNYLNTMSNVILKNNGTIDKFIGDAIMAFWNAPIDDNQHKQHASKTAIEMIEALENFNKKYQMDPELHIGIGINSGDMAVGNFGSDLRFDYTVLGDNVNLASRLESLTKKYGVSVLITGNSIANELPDVIYRLIDVVTVKGKTSAVSIYEVVKNTETQTEITRNYEDGFHLYQKGSFDEAIKTLKKNQNDKPSEILCERIRAMTAPSKDWDGIWKWDEK